MTGTDASGRVFFSHSGAFEDGAATQFSMVPSAKLGIVVLSNGEPMGVPESLAATFLDLALVGRPTIDWFGLYGPTFEAAKQSPSPLAGRPRPAHPRPARPARAYLGRYASAYLGGAEVVRRGSGLALVAGPARKTYRLEHWSGDTFTTGTGRLFGAVTFAGRAAGGRAAAVTVESLDTSGLGTYRRARGGSRGGAPRADRLAQAPPQLGLPGRIGGDAAVLAGAPGAHQLRPVQRVAIEELGEVADRREPMRAVAGALEMRRERLQPQLPDAPGSHDDARRRARKAQRSVRRRDRRR
jgi:hypothetical protein